MTVKVGDVFGSNGHLTVIERLPDKSKQNRFKVLCSICAEDPELFGDGTFDVYGSVLKRSGIPCGCSRFSFSLQQYIIKIERLSVDRFTIESFDEAFDGLSTRVNLSCHKCGGSWKTSITCLLRGNGCAKCRSSNLAKINTKDDEVMINGFNNGDGWLDKTFTRSENTNKRGHRVYFEYSCKNCSNDEYVNENICSGLFTTDSSSLKTGKLSCRCSKVYRWTELQREFQIKRYLEDKDNLLFCGWVDGYQNNLSFVNLECSLHGNFSVSFTNLMGAHSGCPSCCVTGFDKNKPAWLYVILVKGDGRCFTGYGISNVIDKRLRTHYNNLDKLKLNVATTKIYPLEGNLAATLEKEIGVNFEIVSQGIEGFIKEATYGESFDSVVDFIERKIDGQNSCSTTHRR